MRDYIHVMDIANAHTKAHIYTLEGNNEHNCDVFNLGSGNGVTVLELIHAFEKVSGMPLNYKTGPRRPGDVVAVYADNHKARALLDWEIRYGLDQMMSTAWEWELTMKKEAERIQLN